MIALERRPLTAMACVLGALALAGCGQNSAGTPAQTALQAQALPPPLPLTTDAAPPPPPAPAASALPSAPPADVSYLQDPSQQYAFADRAANLAQVLGDTPPDYGFDYDGTQPWAWRGDGFVRVVEPTPDGERYYYYDAGSSSPYLIQDGGYAYGFSGGNLVVIYGPNGRVLGDDQAQVRAELAGRYLARARAIYDAALDSQRRAVALDAWREKRAAIDEERAQWEQQQSEYADWRSYHDDHQAEDQSYWQGERDRRQAEADQYHQALSVRPGGDVAPIATLLAAAAAAYGATHAGQPANAPRPPLAATGAQHGPGPGAGPPPRADQGPVSGPPAPGQNGDHHHDQPAQPPAPPREAPVPPQALPGLQRDRQTHDQPAPQNHPAEGPAPGRPVADHAPLQGPRPGPQAHAPEAHAPAPTPQARPAPPAQPAPVERPRPVQARPVAPPAPPSAPAAPPGKPHGPPRHDEHN